MNFLHVDINKKSNLLTALQVLLPFTFIYKMWFLAELQYNAYNFDISALFSRIFCYLISGAVGYVLAILAVSFSFNLFYKSKFTPCDENFNCRINKQTYMTTCYFVFCIINILCGTLNFIAYAEPISITFMVVLMPTIMSIFSICGIIGLLYLECQKGEFKQLLTSMALPSILFVLLLR